MSSRLDNNLFLPVPTHLDAPVHSHARLPRAFEMPSPPTSSFLGQSSQPQRYSSHIPKPSSSLLSPLAFAPFPRGSMHHHPNITPPTSCEQSVGHLKSSQTVCLQPSFLVAHNDDTGSAPIMDFAGTWPLQWSSQIPRRQATLEPRRPSPTLGQHQLVTPLEQDQPFQTLEQYQLNSIIERHLQPVRPEQHQQRRAKRKVSRGQVYKDEHTLKQHQSCSEVPHGTVPDLPSRREKVKVSVKIPFKPQKPGEYLSFLDLPPALDSVSTRWSPGPTPPVEFMSISSSFVPNISFETPQCQRSSQSKHLSRQYIAAKARSLQSQEPQATNKLSDRRRQQQSTRRKKCLTPVLIPAGDLNDDESMGDNMKMRQTSKVRHLQQSLPRDIAPVPALSAQRTLKKRTLLRARASRYAASADNTLPVNQPDDHERSLPHIPTTKRSIEHHRSSRMEVPRPSQHTVTPKLSVHSPALTMMSISSPHLKSTKAVSPEHLEILQLMPAYSKLAKSKKVCVLVSLAQEIINEGGHFFPDSFPRGWPIDIWLQILDLAGTDILPNFALTNQACRQLARYRQFASVTFTGSDASRQLKDVLLSEYLERVHNDGKTELPSIGPCIRNVVIAPSSSSVPGEQGRVDRIMEDVDMVLGCCLVVPNVMSVNRRVPDLLEDASRPFVTTPPPLFPNRPHCVSLHWPPYVFPDWPRRVSYDWPPLVIPTRPGHVFPDRGSTMNENLDEAEAQNESDLTDVPGMSIVPDVMGKPSIPDNVMSDVVDNPNIVGVPGDSLADTIPEVPEDSLLALTSLHTDDLSSSTVCSAAPTLESITLSASVSSPSRVVTLFEHEGKGLPFQNLRSLTIRKNVKYDPNLLELIIGFKKVSCLEYLDCYMDSATTNSLAKCGTLPQLRILVYRNDGSGLFRTSFLTANKHITMMILDGSFGPTTFKSRIVPKLKQFPKLTSLSLISKGRKNLASGSHTGTWELPPQVLESISGLHKLKQLWLSTGVQEGHEPTWYIDHTVLQKCCRSLPNLEILAVSRDTYPHQDAIQPHGLRGYYEAKRPRTIDALWVRDGFLELSREEQQEVRYKEWEDQHRQDMLDFAAQYVKILPKLKWIYVGQYAVKIVRTKSGEGLPCLESRERVSYEARLWRMFRERT